MTDDRFYEGLARVLDLLPNGFPRTKSGVEIQILRRLFTPEEAHIAGTMSGNSETAGEVAVRAGLPETEVAGKMRVMLRKSLLWGSAKDGVLRFRLAPFIVGFYEEQGDKLDPELAHLFEHYFQDGGLVGIMRPEPALFRVVPAQQALKTELILPYDDIKQVLLQAKRFRIVDCICRNQMSLLGKRQCNFPVHSCLNFSMVEGAVGRLNVSREEALKLLDRAEELGLVHTVSNIARGLYFVCNCCGCCCAVLRGITEFGIENSVARTNYYAEVDPDQCAGCASCEGRCQVGACTVDDIARVDLKKCIGCGVCVTGCTTGAMQLKLRPDAERIIPPENFRTWEQLRLQNRGLLK